MAGDGVASEYSYCQCFRRWAKRVLDLPRGEGEPEGDEGRTLLLEEIWDFVTGMYVWGAPENLAHILLHLYVREDAQAASMLTSLADNELRLLQESGDGEAGEEGIKPCE